MGAKERVSQTGKSGKTMAAYFLELKANVRAMDVANGLLIKAASVAESLKSNDLNARWWANSPPQSALNFMAQTATCGGTSLA